MVYHHPQQLTSITIKGVYKITTPDKAMGTFWWFVTDLLGGANIKAWHKQFISKFYYYQW